MSLDVNLYIPKTEDERYRDSEYSGIFVRSVLGEVEEISRAEWDELFPNVEPDVVAVPFRHGEYGEPDKHKSVYWADITHNLGEMAEEAGVYKHCWRPEEIGIETAGELIEPLKNAIELMKSDPQRFKAFNASNGWGLYKHFVPWLEKYLNACIENPRATIEVSR